MDDLNETPQAAEKQEERERQLMTRLLIMDRELRALRGRSRLLGVGIVVALAAAVVPVLQPDLVSSLASGGDDVLETRGIVLVDRDGTARGEWAVDDAGNATLAMFDRQHGQRLTLTVRSEGFPGLSLSNAAGERRVALGLLPDETSSLVFADGAGVPRTVLGLVRGDAASLVLADAQGVSRIGLGLNGEGLGSVILPDEPTEGSGAGESRP
ncbi:MAG TPA: hypothetical protein VLA43_13820 [Longimicrobiales bacterium]|nr:hypothetical protein [Longimicrobiales bacterium]